MSNTYANSIGDFITTTIENYLPQKGKFADLATNFPDYLCTHRFFTANKTVTEGNGLYTFNIKTTNDGNFRDDVGLFDEDTPVRRDMFVEGQVDETGFNISTHFDVNERKLQSPNQRVKVDYIEAHMDSIFQRYFEELEVRLFTFPSSSSTRGLLGFPYWIVHSTTAAFGFNGGNPSGHSSGAGNVSSTTYPAWANGTGEWNSLSDEDGLDLLSVAMDRCNFRSTGRTLANKDTDAVENKFSLVTNYDNKRSYQRYLRTQNDNLGTDGGKYRDDCYFRSTELIHSWALSLSTLGDGQSNAAATTTSAALDPIYGICWDTMKFHVASGMDMQLTGPRPARTNGSFVGWTSTRWAKCAATTVVATLFSPSPAN